jgi:hypothetical protein
MIACQRPHPRLGGSTTRSRRAAQRGLDVRLTGNHRYVIFSLAYQLVILYRFKTNRMASELVGFQNSARGNRCPAATGPVPRLDIAAETRNLIALARDSPPRPVALTTLAANVRAVGSGCRVNGYYQR